jgi:hypothetical protein
MREIFAIFAGSARVQKAERRAAAEYLHLVVLAESEFAIGVELILRSA